MSAAGGVQRRRRRGGQSIIGFTEAELGLFIALLFFGLMLLGRSGTPTPARTGTAPVPDSVARDNPRVARLLALAEKLDSLERALRTAYARDSALASQLAAMQRQRDSLRLLKSSTGTLAQGLPGAADHAPSPSALGSTASLGEQLVQVERTIATSTLVRTSAAASLTALAQETSAARQRIDSIAPALAQALTPPTTPLVPALAAAAAPAAARVVGTPGTPTRVVGAAGAVRAGAPGAGAAAPAGAATSGSPRTLASYSPAEVRRALQLLAESRTNGNGLPTGGGAQVGNGPASGSGSGGGGASGGGGSAGGGAARGGGRAVQSVAAATAGARARSRQTPTCEELGVDTGAVAEIAILASDLYDVRGKAGPLATVLAVLAPEIATAKKFECRHRVLVRVGPQLSADDYVFAVNALLPYFNTELARDRKRP